jgi:hypothetical protein
MCAQQSLEAAATEALVIYRASLRAVEAVEAKLQRAIRPVGGFDPDEFSELQAAYVRSVRLMRVSQSVLEKLIDELGYFPSVPEPSGFH